MRFMFLLASITLACGGRIDGDGVNPAIPTPTDDAAIDHDAPAPRAVDAGEEDSTPAPAPVADPFSPGQDWVGTYTCPQGLTNLDLRIVSMHGDAIDDALFLFDWTSGQTSGSFHLSGLFDPSTGVATFTPMGWISQPGSNWYTVGLSGNASATSYTGDITGPGCGTFSLERSP